MLEYKARGRAYPKHAPAVYLIFHNGDRALLDPLSDDLLTACELALWRRSGECVELGEGSPLEVMSLAVALVTPRLLSDREGAWREVNYFKERRVPVLPILVAPCRTEEYTALFGAVQYLDRTSRDVTAIDYTVKLEGYLKVTFLSTEHEERIRAEFDNYIFLSYRKLDRASAHGLMRRIHGIEGMTDVAIWYDEFLRPAAEFDVELTRQIERADAFVMAVTPRLLEPDNYVLREEYPLAKRLGKPIVAAIAEPTDAYAAAGVLSGTPLTDDDALEEALLAALGERVNRENDSDPEHLYLIGLAYLYGVDVEVDRERGIALLERSAELGSIEATAKLASAYETGFGVTADIERAEELLTRALKLGLEEANAEGTVGSHAICLWLCSELMGLARRNELFALCEISDIGADLADNLIKSGNCDPTLASLALDYGVERARLYDYKGDPEGVITACHRSLDSVASMPDSELSFDDSLTKLRLISILASALSTVGRVEEALVHSRDAAERATALLSSEENRPTELLAIVDIIGSARSIEQDTERKLGYSATVVAASSQLYAMTGSSYHGERYLGEICSHAMYLALSGDTDAAEERLRVAEELARELTARWGSSRVDEHILSLRADILDERGRIQEAIEVRRQKYEQSLSDYNDKGGYRSAALVSIEARIIANSYRSIGDEASYRVWLAHALRYATEAVEQNPSSEAYRSLSELYDRVAELPSVDREWWRSARRLNAEEHTAYTVNEESRRMDYEREILPKMRSLIRWSCIAAAALCALLLILILSPKPMSWQLSAVTASVLGVAPLYLWLDALSKYMEARHNEKRRTRTTIGERCELGDYESRILRQYGLEVFILRYSIAATVLLAIALIALLAIMSLGLDTVLLWVVCGVIFAVVLSLRLLRYISTLICNGIFRSVGRL